MTEFITNAELRIEVERLCDENDELKAENVKLRDENARLRSCISDDVENAQMIIGENTKLRELVGGLEHCSQGFECGCCPLYDPSGTNHRRCESLERELGIEVD